MACDLVLIANASTFQHSHFLYRPTNNLHITAIYCQYRIVDGVLT